MTYEFLSAYTSHSQKPILRIIVVTRTLDTVKQKNFFACFPASFLSIGCCACVRIKFYKWHLEWVKNLEGIRLLHGYLDFCLSTIAFHLIWFLWDKKGERVETQSTVRNKMNALRREKLWWQLIKVKLNMSLHNVKGLEGILMKF